MPLTEETPVWHQPVWDQLFPCLWSPLLGLSKLRGICFALDTGPVLLLAPPRPIVAIVSEEITCQSDWLQPLLDCGKPFWCRADDNESLIEWLTTSTDLQVLMTPLTWRSAVPSRPPVCNWMALLFAIISLSFNQQEFNKWMWLITARWPSHLTLLWKTCIKLSTWNY